MPHEGVSLVSFDKGAFQSYGLDRRQRNEDRTTAPRRGYLSGP